MAASGSATSSTTTPLSIKVPPSVESDPSDNEDSDAGELFEIEESEAPQVPLYLLRDEGSIKWALLTDLLFMLKVKSKDTLLKQVTDQINIFIKNNCLINICICYSRSARPVRCLARTIASCCAS